MKKRPLIIGVIAIIIAGVLIFAYYSNNNSPASNNANNSSATKTTTFDENSLINRGVTSGQLSNLEQVLTQYLNSQGKKPGSVDFNNIQRTPTNPDTTTPFSELTFIVQVDGKPAYKAKLDSFSTSEIRLYLYTLDGNTLLYDSQNVGGSSNQ